MKLVKKIGTLSLITCALIAAQSAYAQSSTSNKDWANSAWYIGTGIGQTRTNIDDQRIINSLINNGASNVLFSADERDAGYKLYIGKQLNQNFSLEGGYFNLGKSSFNAIANPGSLSGEVKFQGVNLDLVAQLPFTDRFSAFGRLGMHYTEARARFAGDRLYAVTNPSPKERKMNGKVGLGLEYKLTEAFSVRGEMERYRVNDAVQNRGDVDFYSINLVYKLGKPAPMTAKYVPEPEVIVAPPEPVAIVPTPVAPVPVPVAPVPVSEKVTFSAEALFDFDKSVVKSDGKNALDKMLGDLQNMDTEVMVTVGHTDSIGNDDYNQKLSVRRADAVKAYLISRGISSERVYSDGKGETQPIADNSTSEGRKKNRRVIVEVVGVRR